MAEIREEYIRGTIFYKKVGDDITILRLERIKNENCYVFTKKGDYKERIKLTKAEFDGYVRLIPHGILTVSSVVLDIKKGTKDVIITLHRTEDLDEGDNIPYLVCRQSILDIFTNMTKKEGDNNIYIGMSISKDTCPPDVDYRVTLLADTVLMSSNMAVYLDDNLEDIAHYIPTSKYDEVLSNMKQFEIDDEFKDKYKPYGHCFTLRQLIRYTKFMKDFKLALGVIPIDIAIRRNDDGSIQYRSICSVEFEVGYYMDNAYGILYDYTVDLNNLSNDYVIVCDANHETYIITFEKGTSISEDRKRELQDEMNEVLLR